RGLHRRRVLRRGHRGAPHRQPQPRTRSHAGGQAARSGQGRRGRSPPHRRVGRDRPRADSSEHHASGYEGRRPAATSPGIPGRGHGARGRGLPSRRGDGARPAGPRAGRQRGHRAADAALPGRPGPEAVDRPAAQRRGHGRGAHL
ncbi:MAG: Shikimate 5-dehydrogenase I alpha, partial [uncultured Rubrobacteraceae bacterium]